MNDDQQPPPADRPREWWITRSGRAYRNEEELLPSDEVRIHVIERSAYDRVMDERDEARANQHPWAALEERDRLERALADSKQLREADNKRIQRLERALAICKEQRNEFVLAYRGKTKADIQHLDDEIARLERGEE